MDLNYRPSFLTSYWADICHTAAASADHSLLIASERTRRTSWTSFKRQLKRKFHRTNHFILGDWRGSRNEIHNVGMVIACRRDPVSSNNIEADT